MKDLTGQVFGKLTVIKFLEFRRDHQPYWWCRCDCGTEKAIRSHVLVHGVTKTCGKCKYEDLTGQRFGRLLVIRTTGLRGSNRYWLCLCDCGIEKEVSAGNLKSGTTLSCKCLLIENKTKHGGSSRRNGKDPEYGVWSHIIGRCTNPSDAGWENYGGRGITICDRWRESYANFLADMGRRPSPRHMIERKDNNKGYEPSNCEWSTRQVQNNNTRRNRIIEFRGESKTLAEWGRTTGIRPHCIRQRIDIYGWTIEEALTTSKQPGKMPPRKIAEKLMANASTHAYSSDQITP